MKKLLAVFILVAVGIFLFFSSGTDTSSRFKQSIIPSSEADNRDDPLSILGERVRAFGDACSTWGVGSRQAYAHATSLSEVDFAGTPLTQMEVREMRTEFAETIIERGEYEEAITLLQKIISEEDEEQRVQSDLGTKPQAGHLSKIGHAQAVRSSMLGMAFEETGNPENAYHSYKSARKYLGSVYGQDHPNLIYVFQDEIFAAEAARQNGADLDNLYCQKRDLNIMQIRAVNEGFVDDEDIDPIIPEPLLNDGEPDCPKPPSIPVETPVEKIKIFFGTNRNANKSRNPSKTFGNKRGKLSLGSVDMTVRVYPKVGDLPPRGVVDTSIDDDGDDKEYGVHIVLSRVNKLGSHTEFKQQLGDWVEKSNKDEKEVFVYIHGHNYQFDTAAKLTAQLAIDLDMRNGAIFYSWPAGQRVTLYAKSQKNARRSAAHLQEFLELLAGTEEIDKIHLIAHSMGNVLLTQALANIDVQGFSEEKRPFGQVVWASPDVASVDFIDYTKKIKTNRIADGMTLYASSLDRALSISNWLSSMKRAGQTPPLPGVASVVPTIDTSAGFRAATDVIAHSDYADGAIDDIKSIIWLNLKPDQRCFLGGDLIDDIAYWATGKGLCNEESFRSALSIIRARQSAETLPDFDYVQTMNYVRRDVRPEDWEFAQKLADTIYPGSAADTLQE